MPTWDEILHEIGTTTNVLDLTRRKYVKALSDYTGRNTIIYYSAFLQKPQLVSKGVDFSINDNDKMGFMTVVNKLDPNKGLDLLLHTPGGNVAATESIVSYLKQKFGDDIRAIIPQMAMSAGTMIALSCPTIIMGKESSLGPVDPQFHGLSCQEAVDEFDQAVAEVSANPASLGLWQLRISKYTPTFLVACKNALDWSKSYTKNWLARNYGLDEEAAIEMSKSFVEHSETKSHSRHISVEQCKAIGLNIVELEKDSDLQNLVLSLHHAYMIFFDKSTAFKAVENQIGARYLRVHNGN